MKKIFNIVLLGLVMVAASSCKKYLDVNDNPNSPTSSSPDLVLPQALVATASTALTFNNYGAWVAGYQANASGYGAYGGGVLTYAYTTTDNNGLFTGPYSNIKDYNYVLVNTAPTGDQMYFNAVARTMIAFQFARMVDQYGDLPYFDSFKGATNLTPKYDKAEDIYKDLVKQLNTAIATFKATPTGTTQAIDKTTTGKIDVMFNGNITRWAQFANTLKLRLLVRSAKVPSMATFVAAEKASLPTSNAGYLEDDAIVNPDYVAVAGKVNPMFASYAYTLTSTGADLTRIPTRWALSFYDGGKLVDRHRGAAIYRSFAAGSTKKNQLGNQTGTYDVGIDGSAWFSQQGVDYAAGNTATGSNATSIGIIKGATAGQVIMLAAESYFLQAEAGLSDVNIVTTGTVQSNFEKGISASYTYLYKTPANAVTTQKDPVLYTVTPTPGTIADANPTTGVIPANIPAQYSVTKSLQDYKADNAASFLVNINLAASDEERREAIINQKYIAMNLITSDESWNEYRRTGYPKVTGTTATTTFASTQSSITARPDKLPVRVLYPDEEYKLNPLNVPQNVSTTTSRIFWDLN